MADEFRVAAARVLGVPEDVILAGNGSDDILKVQGAARHVERHPASVAYAQLVGSKVCYRCHVDRPLDMFTAKANGKTYDMCSPCLSEILTEATKDGRRKTRLLN
jgi:hypothetical protein